MRGQTFEIKSRVSECQGNRVDKAARTLPSTLSVAVVAELAMASERSETLPYLTLGGGKRGWRGSGLPRQPAHRLLSTLTLTARRQRTSSVALPVAIPAGPFWMYVPQPPPVMKKPRKSVALSVGAKERRLKTASQRCGEKGAACVQRWARLTYRGLSHRAGIRVTVGAPGPRQSQTAKSRPWAACSGRHTQSHCRGCDGCRRTGREGQ